MSTLLGRYLNTQEPAEIGDIEQRKGVYVLGRSGTGNSSLLVNMMEHDVKNRHGVFFLDPHGEAIHDFRTRFDVAGRTNDIILLDPAKESDRFSINLLACKDINSDGKRQNTYDRAYTVFRNLWVKDKDFGPWLQASLQHALNTRAGIIFSTSVLVNIKRSGRWYKEDDKNVDDWREFIRIVPSPLLRPIKEYKPRMEWFMPKSKKGIDKWKMENHTLVKFSSNIIRQCERGRLFD
jgi:hypothetical protein